MPALDFACLRGDAESVEAAPHVTGSTFVARCFACGSADLTPCDVLQETSGHLEDFRATHECRKCGRRFAIVPPSLTPPEGWP